MKFKVLQDFVLNGVTQKADTIIELNYVQSNLKSIQANIEKVPDKTPLTGAEPQSVLSTIKPGEALTEEQRKKLAEENEAQTAEAHRLAAEQRARDIEAGNTEPAAKLVAEVIKDKLINEQFETAPVIEQTPENTSAPVDNQQPTE